MEKNNKLKKGNQMEINKRRQIKKNIKTNQIELKKNLEIFPLIMAIFPLDNSNRV